MPTKPLTDLNGQLLDGLEFCSRVYTLFESVREADGGRSHLRMRSSHLAKRLIEELLPIRQYVQASYRLGRYISVRWVDGSQQYDAEIRQRGAYVSPNYYPAKGYLEVVCAMHPNDYLMRERLDKEGGAFGLEGLRRLPDRRIESIPVGHEGDEFINSYSRIVLAQIAKKAEKPYPKHTTLIVNCNLNSTYMADEWSALIARVKANLPENSFREIYLYDEVGQYSHRFHPTSEPARKKVSRRKAVRK